MGGGQSILALAWLPPSTQNLLKVGDERAMKKEKSKDIHEREVNTAQGGVATEREVIMKSRSSGANGEIYGMPP